MIQEEKSATLATNNDQTLFEPITIERHFSDIHVDTSNKVKTLMEAMGKGGNNVPMVGAYAINTFKDNDGPNAGCHETDIAKTLGTMGGNPSCNQGGTAVISKDVYGTDVYNFSSTKEIAPTLTTGTGDQQGSGAKVMSNYVVRRLTPTECARLQGFPDDWCDGIPHTDAAEYKMWGNGMALPCALYIMEGAEDYFRELGYDF